MYLFGDDIQRGRWRRRQHGEVLRIIASSIDELHRARSISRDGDETRICGVCIKPLRIFGDFSLDACIEISVMKNVDLTRALFPSPRPADLRRANCRRWWRRRCRRQYIDE